MSSPRPGEPGRYLAEQNELDHEIPDYDNDIRRHGTSDFDSVGTPFQLAVHV